MGLKDTIEFKVDDFKTRLRWMRLHTKEFFDPYFSGVISFIKTKSPALYLRTLLYVQKQQRKRWSRYYRRLSETRGEVIPETPFPVQVRPLSKTLSLKEEIARREKEIGEFDEIFAKQAIQRTIEEIGETMQDAFAQSNKVFAGWRTQSKHFLEFVEKEGGVESFPWVIRWWIRKKVEEEKECLEAIDRILRDDGILPFEPEKESC